MQHFPESIDDYISDDSALRIIDKYVEQLDIEGLGFKKAVYNQNRGDRQLFLCEK
jgi:hypothetical protein